MSLNYWRIPQVHLLTLLALSLWAGALLWAILTVRPLLIGYTGDIRNPDNYYWGMYRGWPLEFQKLETHYAIREDAQNIGKEGDEGRALNVKDFRKVGEAWYVDDSFEWRAIAIGIDCVVFVAGIVAIGIPCEWFSRRFVYRKSTTSPPDNPKAEDHGDGKEVQR